MQSKVRELRDELAKEKKKKGIRFQSDVCDLNKLREFQIDISIGDNTQRGMEMAANLYQFHLCVDERKKTKTYSVNKVLQEANAKHEIEVECGEKQIDCSMSKGSAGNIDVQAIQEATLNIEKNAMFMSGSDSKLEQLTKAAKVTPLKVLAPRGGKIKKGIKGLLGKSAFRKSERLEKKGKVHYQESNDMSVEVKVKSTKETKHIVNSIEAATEDWEINELGDNEARELYIQCLRKRDVQVAMTEIEKYSRKQISDNLFLAREQEREVEACIKEVECEENDNAMSNQEMITQQELDDAIWNVHEETNNSTNMQEKDATTEEDSSKEENQDDTKMELGEEVEDSSMRDKCMKSDIVKNKCLNDNDVSNKITNKKKNQEDYKKKEGSKQELVMQQDTHDQENEINNQWKTVTYGKKETSAKEKVKYTVPFQGIRGQSAQNLLGMPVNQFIPPQNQTEKGKKNSATVVVQEQLEYNIRVKLAANAKATNHVPTFVQKFVRVLRQADATLIVLPYDRKNVNANDIITNEKDFPDTEEQIRKWAVGIRKTRFHKLEFSIRVAATMNFRALTFYCIKQISP